LAAVDHIDVAIYDKRIAVPDMVERRRDRLYDPVAADLADGHYQMPAIDSVAVHLCRIGERRQSDLCDISPWQPIVA
jgi:hypothetical protein